MSLKFTSHAWEELEYWIETYTEVGAKIKELLKDIRRNFFKGVGKPGPLKYDLEGYWSRRITGAHRLVYKVDGKKGENRKCIITQYRVYYDD